MKKLVLTCAALVSLGLHHVMAQNRPVKGQVVDASGEGVPGASVQIKGTKTGTITDADGNFSLEVPDDNNVLIINSVGYGAQEIQAGDGDKVLSVRLSNSAQNLDETVVVGYAAIKRGDITGSVSRVDEKTIKDIPNVTIEKALQGRVAGVQVVQNSGTPGSGIDVRVRGTTSISGGTQPLYVVDGVPVTTENYDQVGVGNQHTNPMAQINPDDIESIDVIKDAATQAIYGARASNGVVLITTKKGKYNQDGKISIQLNTSYGVQNAWKKLKTLNNNQYYALVNEEYSNQMGRPVDAFDPNGPIGLTARPQYYTNNIDYIFRQGTLQDHNISLSGGNAKTKYYAAVGYFQNKGILRASQYDRYSGRVNVETKVSDKVKLGANLSYTNSDERRVRNDNNIYGYLLPALMLAPDQPLKNEDGTYWENDINMENPAANAEVYLNNIKTDRVIGNIFGEVQLAKGLSLRSSFGADVLNSREKVYMPATMYSGKGANGSGTVGNVNFTNWINEDYLSYVNNFGKHSVNAAGGISFIQNRQFSSAAQATNFASPELSNLGSAAIPTTASSLGTVYGLRSYFLNVNYDYDQRYYLTGTFRIDGSSRFAANNKWATFPGISAAWRISNEAFFENAKSVVSDLKIRAAYGKTGNQDGLGNFDSRLLYTTGQYADAIGVYYGQLNNDNLKWETTDQFNVAVDAGFFNDRVYLTAEYYVRKTNDMILNKPYAQQTGFDGRRENIGNMENKGWELAITTQNVKGKFNWTTSLNLSHNANTVTRLYDGKDILLGSSGSTIVREGESIGSFYGWEVEKIFQTQEEIVAANAGSSTGIYQSAKTAPGDIKFRDINGDGRINDLDRTILGTAMPKLFGGFGNNLSWNGFELNIFCQFSLGNKIFNQNRMYTSRMNNPKYNQLDEVEDRWTPTNTDTDVPRAVSGDPNNNGRNSSRYIENGSYFRIKNVTLAYSFPAKWFGFSKNTIKGLRIYATAANLITITRYKGFDPEVNTNDRSSAVLGTDFGTYPQARSYVFGANFTF